MIRLILMLILVWTNSAHADYTITTVKERGIADDLIPCEWDNQDGVPCVTIKKYRTNSNALGDKVSPTLTITKKEIEKYNLIDLPKALNYIQGLDVTQSGPTGQQSSLFLRGTNSNHTLVLLNGIPINDLSTPTGAHDVGQDFMFNVQQIDVYKGSAGAHYGADAVGGAINFRTVVDYQNKFKLSGNGNDRTINGNYFKSINGYDISVSAGQHESQNVSALSGADEKDGTDNKSISVNVSKWYDLIHWRTTWFARNTFSDLDGHTLAIQDGKFADNTFYAVQTGIDYLNNSLTLHTHEYDRDYDDSHYDSLNYTLRGTHQTDTWGIGFDYKHNESYGKSQWSETKGYGHNLGYFFNLSHNIFSYHHRFDEDHETYKLGFFKELEQGLSISGSTSTSYKDKTTWTAMEYGETQELTLTKNNFATTIFKNDIGNLNSDGVEFSYKQDNSKFFISHLNSKTNDSVNLRRPNWTLGFMHTKDLENNFSITTNYKYKGKHLDVHNVTYQNGISMPETHLLDINLGYNYHGIEFGVSLLNLFDEDYESPHGFSQEGRKFTLGFNKSF
jgi:outer membrane cobalamin receptor